MTQEAPRTRPPRFAEWLVDLFASADHAESLLGDLREEFSDIASKSGVVSARRWYWRQAAKTIAHLAGAAFRTAPWLTASTVIGGYLLLAFGSSLPEKLIVAVLELRRHHVVPYYTQREMDAHVFWLNTGILTGRLLVSLFVGCIVALAARGREIVAAMTLAMLRCVSIGAFLMRVATYGPLDAAWMLWSFGDPVAIVLGGVIVREIRSAQSAGRRTSH